MRAAFTDKPVWQAAHISFILFYLMMTKILQDKSLNVRLGSSIPLLFTLGENV